MCGWIPHVQIFTIHYHSTDYVIAFQVSKHERHRSSRTPTSSTNNSATARPRTWQPSLHSISEAASWPCFPNPFKLADCLLRKRQRSCGSLHLFNLSILATTHDLLIKPVKIILVDSGMASCETSDQKLFFFFFFFVSYFRDLGIMHKLCIAEGHMSNIIVIKWSWELKVDALLDI